MLYFSNKKKKICALIAEHTIRMLFMAKECVTKQSAVTKQICQCNSSIVYFSNAPCYEIEVYLFFYCLLVHLLWISLQLAENTEEVIANNESLVYDIVI